MEQKRFRYLPARRYCLGRTPAQSAGKEPLRRKIMTTVQFYHLTTTPLERALPKLLEKAVAGKYRTLLVAESDARVEQLNQLLWTYDPGSFLPHGSVSDGNTELQPVLIATDQAPLNNPNLLFIINGSMAEKTPQFERIIDMFDGRDPQ